METSRTQNIVIRTYQAQDKEKVFDVFRTSLLSVIDYGMLNYKTSKLITLNILEKYQDSKYSIFLIILFLIFNTKTFVFHLFDNNSFYYYMCVIIVLFVIVVILFLFYRYFNVKEFIEYAENAIKTDFENPEKWVNGTISNLWVACINEEVVGLVGIIPFQKENCFHKIKTTGAKVAELKRMYVSPNHMRKGIASNLFKTVEKWCIDNEYDEIVLSTTSYQTDAISCYLKNGFSVSERIIREFWIANHVILIKSLKTKIC